MFSLFGHHAEAIFNIEINGRDYPPGPVAPAVHAGFAPVAWGESSPIAGTPVVLRSERPPLPKLPLFITLLSLRN